METRLKRIASNVRKATKKDARILASLHGESFGVDRWNLTQIAESLALETTLALMVQDGETTWGFILCQIAGEEAEILTFCVSPSVRRSGTGAFLLFAALEEMRQMKVKMVHLEVAADNDAALGLYKKADFNLVGRRAKYYKHDGLEIDAVRMAFDL